MLSIHKLSPAQSPPLNSKLSHLSTWISDSQTTKSPNPTFLSEPEVTLSPFWPNPSAESPAPLPPLHCTSRQVDPWQDPGSAHLATPLLPACADWPALVQGLPSEACLLRQVLLSTAGGDPPLVRPCTSFPFHVEQNLKLLCHDSL